MIDKNIIAKKIKEVILLLINEDYKKLKEKGYLGSLNTEDVSDAINSYPGKITLPSDDELLNFTVYNLSENEVYVEFDLYLDGNKSDLTVCSEITQNHGKINIRIQDLRVL